MKAKHHTITFEQLEDALENLAVTIASSSRERKTLTARLNGNLEVWVGNERKYVGMQPYVAMTVYNEITEEYKPVKTNFKL